MSEQSAIAWRDEFSTGIGSVDHEHKELVQLLNDVIVMLDENRDHDAVVEALGEVNARISAHFALEETIMRGAKYADFVPHKEDHERLLDEIRDIMDAYEEGDYENRRADFVKHLTDWFVSHFSTMDSKLHSSLLD